MLEKNQKALQEHYSELWTKLSETDKDYSDVAFTEKAKNGDDIVCYKKDEKVFYLNSRYNPTKEAEKFSEDHIKIAEESVVCYFGMANGFFARELKDKAEHDPLILVYEPSIEIFKTVLDTIDISDLLSEQKISFVVEGLNTDQFRNFLYYNLRHWNRFNSKFIVLPKYQELFHDSCDRFVDTIQEALLYVQSQINTGADFGKYMLENELMNMKHLKGCRNGRELEGKFPEDIPAILVAAGPSLQKNIHLLKEAKGKALITVVDRALKHVIDAGVVPDMVFAIDFMKPLDLFETDGVSQIPLVVAPELNYKVLDQIKPQNLIIDGADDLVYDDLFRQEGSELWQVNSGGSVSTSAIANMIAWGIKRIILLGQDLAMSGNVEYAGEESKEFAAESLDMSYVEGIEEERVLTRTDYLSYIRWIERVAGDMEDVRIIDATEGGSKKKNTEVMTFRDVLDQEITEQYDITGILEGVPRLFEDNHETRIMALFAEIRENMRKMKNKLKEGVSSCRNAINSLKADDFKVRELKSINDQIGKLDQFILESKEYTVLKMLIFDAEFTFSSDVFDNFDDDKAEAIRMYAKSLRYYESILEQIPVFLDMLERAEKHLMSEA